MANTTATLRKVLQTRSTQELAKLSEHWAVARVIPENRSEIGEDENIMEITSVRFAWAALSTTARDLLHQMISFEVMDGIPREDLQKLARLTDAAFVAALAELEQNLMLIEIRPDAKVRQRLETRAQKVEYVLAIPKDFYAMFTRIDREIYDPQRDSTKLSLSDLLATLDLSTLQTIYMLNTIQSGSFGLGMYTSMHDSRSIAHSLAGKLVQPTIVEMLWEKLDATEQQICRQLCRADGVAAVAEVQSALKLSRSAIATYIRRLEHYGLVFNAFSDQTYKIFIGRGTFKVLRKLIGEIDQLQEQTKNASSASIERETAPVLIHESRQQLLADLAIVVNAVYQMVIEPTQAGYVPKRLANKIFPLLHGSRPMYYEGTDDYLDMVFSIAEALDLINLQQNNGQKARYQPGPRLKDWMGLEADEQTRRLLELWQKVSVREWSDVSGVHYRPSNYGFGYSIESQSARRGLLEYLTAHCQPGRWYALRPLLQTIKANHLFLLREHSRYSAYNGQRNRKEVLANWEHIDAEIIAGLIASSLHEMGLVTLGFDADPAPDSAEARNPDAFQLTELAAQTLWNSHPTDPADAPRPRSLIIQPNFELLLLQPDYITLYKLLPFVKVEQIEMVSRLTLTQESVRRGVEAGYGVEHIIRTLQECSQKELPQNVLYTLQDWGKLYKDATISQLILLEVSSASIADEICASTKLRTLELRRLGPCAIAVGGQVSLQALRTALEKEGVILHIQGDILSAREIATATTSGYGRRR